MNRLLEPRGVAAITIAVVGLVALLSAGLRPLAGRVDVSALPHVDAALNALAAILLVSGWRAIRQGRVEAHRRRMLGAFAASAAFLACYVAYHTFKPEPVRYAGPFRPAYLVLLGSHVVLAAVVLPLALLTLGRGLADDRPRHRRIARWTLPTWLYVSVTGVLVYLALQLAPATGAP